jgi:hypothetical protein
VGRVSGGAVDHVVPCRVSSASGDNQQFFQIGQRQRLVTGSVGEYPVRNLGSHKKPSGAAAKERFHKTEGQHVLNSWLPCRISHGELLFNRLLPVQKQVPRIGIPVTCSSSQ